MVEEWIIRGAIAILAAIAGAVLRPHVEDRLRRRREEEARLRQRNATVRQMVEERIRRFRRQQHFASSVAALLDAGSTGNDALRTAFDQSGPIFGLEESDGWNLNRINDPLLKAQCEELDNSANIFCQWAVAASQGRSWEREELLRKVPYQDLRWQELLEQIVARMDALDWQPVSYTTRVGV